MNRPNYTNFLGSPAAEHRGAFLVRTAAALVAGSAIVLAGMLPVSAAPPTAKHKTTHTVHHTTRKHTAATARKTTRYTSVRPKQITIRGAGWNHPYANATGATAPRISVTVGKTAPIAAATRPNHVGAPGDDNGPRTGGEIQPDGSVVPGTSNPGLPGPNGPAAPIGNVPGIVAPPTGPVIVGDPGVAPPVVVTPPVVTTPVVPPTNGPAAPITPAGPVVPTIP